LSPATQGETNEEAYRGDRPYTDVWLGIRPEHRRPRKVPDLINKPGMNNMDKGSMNSGMKDGLKNDTISKDGMKKEGMKDGMKKDGMSK
jgi:hypothetical protein